MSQNEVAAFEAGPHAKAACRLRRWDDAAKEPGLEVPPLESYRGLLESVLREVYVRQSVDLPPLLGLLLAVPRPTSRLRARMS